MATLLSNLHPDQGFHPISTSHISIHDPILLECDLHAYFHLPPDLFVDVHELRNHALSYTFEHFGTSNIELPLSAVDQSGSSLILNVLNPTASSELEIRVPLHARYGTVVDDRSHEAIPLSWPQMFFACPQRPHFASSSSFETHSQLIDMPESFRASLGWPSTAPSRTQIMVLAENNSTSSPTNWVYVPVGSSQDLPFVLVGTTLTIVVMFFFVASEMLKVFWRLREKVVVKEE